MHKPSKPKALRRKEAVYRETTSVSTKKERKGINIEHRSGRKHLRFYISSWVKTAKSDSEMSEEERFEVYNNLQIFINFKTTNDSSSSGNLFTKSEKNIRQQLKQLLQLLQIFVVPFSRSLFNKVADVNAYFSFPVKLRRQKFQ